MAKIKEYQLDTTIVGEIKDKDSRVYEATSTNGTTYTLGTDRLAFQFICKKTNTGTVTLTTEAGIFPVKKTDGTELKAQDWLQGEVYSVALVGSEYIYDENVNATINVKNTLKEVDGKQILETDANGNITTADISSSNSYSYPFISTIAQLNNGSNRYKIKKLGSGINGFHTNVDLIDVLNTLTLKTGTFDNLITGEIIKVNAVDNEVERHVNEVKTKAELIGTGSFWCSNANAAALGLPVKGSNWSIMVSHNGDGTYWATAQCADKGQTFMTNYTIGNTWQNWDQVVKGNANIYHEKITLTGFPQTATLTFDKDVNVADLQIDINGTTEPKPGTGSMIRTAVKLILNNNTTVLGTNRVVFLKNDSTNNVKTQIEYILNLSYLRCGTCDLVNAANAFHNTLRFYILQEQNLPDKYYAWLETVSGTSDPGATSGFLSNCSDAYQMVPSAGNNTIKSISFELESFIGFTEINLKIMNKSEKLNYTITKATRSIEAIDKDINIVSNYGLTQEYKDSIEKLEKSNIEYEPIEETIQHLMEEKNTISRINKGEI